MQSHDCILFYKRVELFFSLFKKLNFKVVNDSKYGKLKLKSVYFFERLSLFLKFEWRF